jgi:two-component system, LytTR family, response regulator LytT
MKIVIIEDEKLFADDLAETILKVIPDCTISALLYSVKSAISWFHKNEQPDLIFSDIQLGDGLSFEIFKKIPTNAPVIFCTAYDEYALKAFDANGIDYILKPFDKSKIEAALNKYKKLKDKLSENSTRLDKIVQLFENYRNQNRGSVLVYRQDKILPVRIEDIALFFIENGITHIITFDQKKFTINKPLDELDNMVTPYFFRANRQYLINRKAIKEASQYFARKLSVTLSIPFKETIIVNKVKVPAFLNWLSGS